LLHLQAAFGADEFSVERWRHFRSVDLYEELSNLLKAGRLDIASSVGGHFSDVLSEKVVSDLDSILAMLPDVVRVEELCSWLAGVVLPPILESQNVNLIDSLARWVEKRATDMEVTHKHGWPTNAIKLCEVMSNVDDGRMLGHVKPKEYAHRVVGLSVPATSWDDARQSQNALVRLRMLRNDLQEIVDLRERYSCSLSLAEFRSETVQSLAYWLLDRVISAPTMSAAVSDIVRPYASQNLLNLDQLLSSYVTELVHQRSSGGTHVTSTVWESKAIEILHNISDQTLSEQTLLSILSAAQFPWTDDVSNAVTSALARNPSHATLKGLGQLASLKHILIGYDLQRFNFVETAHSKDLAFYILMQDKATAVQDALVVTDVYSNVGPVEVYLFRCCFLAQRDRAHEIVDLLRGIAVQSPLLDKICAKFVTHCSIILSDPVNNFRSQYATAAQHIGRLLTRLTPDCRQEVEDQLSDLDAVGRLESQFGLLSVDDYSTAYKRYQFFEKCMNVSLENDVGNTASLSRNAATNTSCPAAATTPISRLNLARLLKMPACTAKVWQAVTEAHNGSIFAAVELVEHIVETWDGSLVQMVKHVLRILKALCDSIESGCKASKAEVEAIHRMSSKLLTAAPAVMLEQCMKVVQTIRLASEMVNQCCATENTTSMLSGKPDPYKHWTFDDYLTDEDCGGIIMDLQSAIPKAFAFVAAVIPPTDTPTFLYPVAPLPPIDSVSRGLEELLTASDQTRLFLGYFLEATALFGRVMKLELLHSAILKALKRCVVKRRADYQLALTSAFSVPSSRVVEYLHKLARSAGIQYKKALAIAQVGIMFAQLTDNTADLSLAQKVVTEARWGYRLAKAQISFRECYLGTEDKRSLMPKLAANEHISVTDVMEYCQDFKLDISDSLSFYLFCLLLPSSNFTSVDSTTTLSKVWKQASEACHHIKPESLVSTLEKILDKTSPYDYEQLEFVLEQLQLTGPLFLEKLNRTLDLTTVDRDRKLLVCLKSYHRISTPVEDELLLSGEEGVKDHLPFHMLTVKEQRWRIITSELNASTIDLWIPMAALLGLPADQIYTTAIRNIVQSHVSNVCPVD